MIKNSGLARGLTLVAGGSLVVALLAGCGTDGRSGSPSTQAAPVSATPAVRSPGATSPVPTPTESDSALKVLPLVAAGQTALKKVGHGTVTSIDLERRGTMWEVDVVVSSGAKYAVHVSSSGLRVLSGPSLEPEDAEDRAENQQMVQAANLDFKAAAAKVLEARSGQITDLSLDDHGGSIVWEADVEHSGVDYEVKIDAVTGKVVQNQPHD